MWCFVLLVNEWNCKRLDVLFNYYKEFFFDLFVYFKIFFEDFLFKNMSLIKEFIVSMINIFFFLLNNCIYVF